MKFGKVIYSDDAEIVWDAHRLKVFLLKIRFEAALFIMN